VTHLSDLQPDSVLSYLIALLFPALDAVLPVLPSETAIVALGVATAGSVDPRLVFLVILAACGAVVGDNVCFVIGRHFGPWVDRRFFGSERGARSRSWARKTLDRFGARLVIVCRFIPGGRTVVTFTCGAVGYPWRRFFPVTVLSGVIWASYAFAIGRIGGRTFASKPWLGLVVALGLAFVVSLTVGVVRRLIQWRSHSLAKGRRASGEARTSAQSDSHRARPGQSCGVDPAWDEHARVLELRHRPLYQRDGIGGLDGSRVDGTARQGSDVEHRDGNHRFAEVGVDRRFGRPKS
jgi:membrane-associated protein